MPRLIPFRLGAVCALAVVLVLATAAVAVAKGPSAQLRVVAGSKILVDKALVAGTTAVPTSKKADCFGPESVGSGKSVDVTGPTPLGLLARAARNTASLRPLLITDAFSFGLGLCAIGGKKPSGEGFWQLRVNHEAAMVGGDQLKLRNGDSVLWYLAAGFPGPDELWLTAPKRVGSGATFTARVFAYDEAGKRSPVAGAKVSGAKGVSGSDGRVRLALDAPKQLVARLAGAIPANRAPVCVAGKCPRG